ncbi:MAG: Na/Pi symporter, partial [Bacteroidales bacterium]|nr:Na/Pi symporter [Bacteroidales bacterium]MDD3911754.1 Na/Pi symporter [Bacteroidales bacterium]
MNVVYGILKLLGALGLFLYGMTMMSEALQKVAGDKLRSFLAAMTSNAFKRILTGLCVTAIIQSSSATTVMVVSFVNAGLLSLSQSIGVIMGANIGTTVTAWLLALLGFQGSLSSITIPLIGFGFVFMMCKSKKKKSIGEMIIGFALLFLGLEFLKNSVPDLNHSPQVIEFIRKWSSYGNWSIILYVLIGTVL